MVFLVLEKGIIKHHRREWILGSKLRCGQDDQHAAERMCVVASLFSNAGWV